VSPGDTAARSIWRFACLITPGLNIRWMSRFTSAMYRAASASPSSSIAARRGYSSRSFGPMERSKMSEVECAGSVETSRMR
jgi:hypothetical protein